MWSDGLNSSNSDQAAILPKSDFRVSRGRVRDMWPPRLQLHEC